MTEHRAAASKNSSKDLRAPVCDDSETQQESVDDVLRVVIAALGGVGLLVVLAAYVVGDAKYCAALKKTQQEHQTEETWLELVARKPENEHSSGYAFLVSEALLGT